MKAIRVGQDRNLELCNVPEPAEPAAGYVTVRIAAAAINHGDKTFLKAPDAAGATRARSTRVHDVWGASAAGTVTAVGSGVPERYRGRKVAIYRGLQGDLPGVGTWSEIAQLPHLTCLPLPDDVDERDYSGSLVNAATAYSFLEQALDEGHKGILATAGSSATGRAMLALSRRRGVPLALLVRRAESKGELIKLGATHVVSTEDEDFLLQLERMSEELRTTAIFDGVGGALIGRIMASLPARSTFFFYGFLSGSEPVSFNSALFMRKGTTMRRFSNFETATVQDPKRLAAMLQDLESVIADPLFRIQTGKEFGFADIEMAMAYDALRGPKPIFVPTAVSLKAT